MGEQRNIYGGLFESQFCAQHMEHCLVHRTCLLSGHELLQGQGWAWSLIQKWVTEADTTSVSLAALAKIDLFPKSMAIQQETER